MAMCNLMRCVARPMACGVPLAIGLMGGFTSGAHTVAADYPGGRGSRRAAEPTMRAGDRWLRIGGRSGFAFGRNPTESSVEAFEERFREMEASGETLARLHLMHGIPHRSPPGEVDEAWATHWERVFDAADKHGIAVIPVFTIWAQWNDGSGGELWHVWHDNPYNASRGGPARSPSEILADTACRRVWLPWLGALITRWQSRPNILAWEPISELDLVTGSTPPAGAAFIEAAAAVIRRLDRRNRPVTVSLSGIRDWPEVFSSKAVDIVQAHPYALEAPHAGRLTDLLIEVTRDRIGKYGKPVLLGECGLDWRPPRNTLTEADRAHVAIRHALWASVVSGALSGRMLWWEDGYDKNEKSDVARRYRNASAPVARFVRRIRYSDLQPAACTMTTQVKGAALAGQRLAIGWFRDARSDPPDWPERWVDGQTVTVAVPGRSGLWSIEFADTRTGLPCGRQNVQVTSGQLTVRLPAFRESIAFKAAPQ